MGPHPVSLHTKPTFILMNYYQDVKIYLTTHYEFSEEARPALCPHCQVGKPHRHGFFLRTVHTLEESIEIPVYRFKCAKCSHTFSLLPSFIGKHQQVTWDVQEEIYHLHEEGASYEQAGEAIPSPTGPLSGKTVSRQISYWRETLTKKKEAFIKWILTLYPTVELPQADALKPLHWLRMLITNAKPFYPKIGVFHGLAQFR